MHCLFKTTLCCIATPILLFVLGASFLHLNRNSPQIMGVIPFVTPRETWGITPSSVPPQVGKTVVVTGANAGLGFSSVKILVDAGAHVVMGCRSVAKCAAAHQRILHHNNQASVEVGIVDLADLASIQTFVHTFNANHPTGLNALMLNAGVMACPYGLTKDGIERQFGTNHVGHQYLTQLLLPSILKKSSHDAMTHIVSLSSTASFATYEPQGVKLTLDDINNEGEYNTMKAYGQSKLANILFVQELSERVVAQGSNVMVTAVHPGLVTTELSRHFKQAMPSFMAPVLDQLFGRIAWTSDVAALSQVFAMTSTKLQTDPETYRGKFIVPLARVGVPPVHAGNVELQKRLWTFTEELIQEKMALRTGAVKQKKQSGGKKIKMAEEL